MDEAEAWHYTWEEAGLTWPKIPDPAVHTAHLYSVLTGSLVTGLTERASAMQRVYYCALSEEASRPVTRALHPPGFCGSQTR